MLKTMKLLLAAAFLLAGLSLAGCKNCKEDNNSGTGSVTPPSKIDKVFHLCLVDKKTGKSLVGEGADQIPLSNIDIVGANYRDVVQYYDLLVKDMKTSIDPRTGHIVMGPIKWGHDVQQSFFVRVLDSPKRVLGEIPPGYKLLWIVMSKEAEILDECNSKIWVDYSHYKKGVSTQGVLVSKYKGNGLTDTLRLEVER